MKHVSVRKCKVMLTGIFCLSCSLSACSSASSSALNTPETGNETASTTYTVPKPLEETRPDSAVEPVQSADPVKEDEEKESETQDSQPDNIFQETVLLDQDGMKIVARSFEPEGSWLGARLKLYIENNSDSSKTVQFRKVTINGFMVDPYASCTVQEGKKASDDIVFSASDLKENGIEWIHTIELSPLVFDSEDWMESTEYSPVVLHVAEEIEGKKMGTDLDNELNQILYENGGLTVIAKSLDMDGSWLGPALKLYVENNTDQAWTVQFRDVSVNGFMTDTIASIEVEPGKKANDSLVFSQSDLEENEIDVMDQIELTPHIFRSDDWMDSQTSEPVVIELS